MKPRLLPSTDRPMTLTYPGGATVDLDEKNEVEEGWVQTEEVVLDWCANYKQGITAVDLAAASGLSPEHAKDRLVNLWENDFLSVEGGIHDGCFFLLVSVESNPMEGEQKS